jgi:hypothetical protein
MGLMGRRAAGRGGHAQQDDKIDQGQHDNKNTPFVYFHNPSRKILSLYVIQINHHTSLSVTEEKDQAKDGWLRESTG